MILRIQDIGIVHRADIEIEGLTVISGKNDSGKSTIGKVLYALFHGVDKSSVDYPSAAKQYLIEDFLSFVDLVNDDGIQKPKNRLLDKIRIKDGYDLQRIEEYVLDVNHRPLMDKNKDKADKIRNILLEKLQEIKSISFQNDVLISTVLDTVEEEFSQQVGNVYSDSLGKVSCSIDAQEFGLIRVGDAGNILAYEDGILNLSELRIFSDVNLVDTPLIIDDLEQWRSLTNGFYNMGLHKKSLLEKLSMKRNDGNIIESVKEKKNLQRIQEEIHRVLKGNIAYSKRYIYQVDKKKFSLSAMATGLKSYAIIQLLLQNGYLRENSLLIIDEPEVHLHPEWQLFFAELLVLLVKEVHVYIVLATHSPYFLQAIDLYQKKYSLQAKTHYYLAERKEEGAVIRNIDGHLEESYNLMAVPILLLNREKEEWEMSQMEMRESSDVD